MTRTFTGLCIAAALGMVAPIAAQTPSTPPPGGTTGHAYGSRSDDDKTAVTITGCLSKDANGDYILTNAQSSMGSSNSSAYGEGGTATGTTGTASRAYGGATKAGTTWQLAGGHDLAKHVGHKIQVKGVESPGTAGTSGTTTGSTSGANGMVRHRLDVKSVKMISTSCP